jgi:hypothetical protein
MEGITEHVMKRGFIQYDPETKRHSMHWKTPTSPRMKKARMGKSKVKAVADLLNRVSADDLQHCFEQWKIRVQRCIDKGGEYIERNIN